MGFFYRCVPLSPIKAALTQTDGMKIPFLHVCREIHVQNWPWNALRMLSSLPASPLGGIGSDVRI
jgi:hypothetical protein